MSDDKESVEKSVVEILTQDIQSHRDYIQRLYRHALFVGGGVLIGGIALATWILGNQLDASILQHRIDDELRKKVDAITQTNVDASAAAISRAANEAVATAVATIDSEGNSAIAAAQIAVDQYASDRLASEVENNIAPRLEALSQASIEDLTAAIAFPSGLVAAFDRPSACPDGWSPFADGQSRFIVGASFGSSSGRPEVLELTQRRFREHNGDEAVRLTQDEIPGHAHDTQVNAGEPRFGAGQPTTVLVGRTWTSGPAARTSIVGGSQPHNNMPPYIALYFCKKD